MNADQLTNTIEELLRDEFPDCDVGRIADETCVGFDDVEGNIFFIEIKGE